MPYSCVSEGLDLSQMVMDIQKQFKITVFIIPHNFCCNKIGKKPFPVTTPGQCPTPVSQRGWTSPWWSWISGNNLEQLFSSSPITSVTATLSKAIPWDAPCKCPTPGRQRCWTSPRWSWSFGNNWIWSSHHKLQLSFCKLVSKLPSSASRQKNVSNVV